MDEGLAIYENMWEASDLDHSIDMSKGFWVVLLLRDVSSSQEKSVDLLGTLNIYFLPDQAWVDDRILSTNMQLVEIEAQDLYHFSEWKEHIRADVGQIKAADISV